MTSRRSRHPDPARAARRSERREQLLDGALAAIRREGPDVSMEAIAAEGGVSKPILYRHFGDRQGLVSALAARFTDRLSVELADALNQDAPPHQVLLSTIDTYVRFIDADPDVYRFLTRTSGAPAETLTGLVHQMAAEVAVVLGERLRDAGLDSGAAEPWAHGIVGMVHLAGDWWVERRSMPRSRLVAYLGTLLWSGMGGLEGARDVGDATGRAVDAEQARLALVDEEVS